MDIKKKTPYVFIFIKLVSILMYNTNNKYPNILKEKIMKFFLCLIIK